MGASDGIKINYQIRTNLMEDYFKVLVAALSTAILVSPLGIRLAMAQSVQSAAPSFLIAARADRGSPPSNPRRFIRVLSPLVGASPSRAAGTSKARIISGRLAAPRGLLGRAP
jgi:hypothetical protein